jgi:ribonuclease HI
MSNSLSPAWVFQTDGAAKDNPSGPGGIGVALFRCRDGEQREKAWSAMKFIGEKVTNNLSEYEGLIRALEAMKELKIRRATIEMDSELVVQQMCGTYLVRTRGLQEPYQRAQKLKEEITAVANGVVGSVIIKWIPREENEVADELSKRSANNKTTSSEFDRGWNAQRINTLCAAEILPAPQPRNPYLEHQLEEEDGNSDEEVTDVNHALECTCCAVLCADVSKLQTHLNRFHLDHTEAEINNSAILRHRGIVFIRCAGCDNLFKGDRGLASHHARTPACQNHRENARHNAQAAAELLANAAEGTPTDANELSNLDSLEGLRELSSVFHRSISYPKAKLVTLMTQVSCQLFDAMSCTTQPRPDSTAADGADLQPARTAAAFLILPGLLRAYSDLKMKPEEVLYEALAARCTAMPILHAALTLVRTKKVKHGGPHAPAAVR